MAQLQSRGGAAAQPAIILNQFAPMYGLPNPSPFCIKIETYLRMVGFQYATKIIKGPPRSFTGKAPYIEVDGALHCDSGLIIAHLESAYGHRVEGRLTLAERAQSLAMQRLMEEHLYWALVYARWLDPDNMGPVSGYIRDVIGVPGWLLTFIKPLVQQQMRKAVRAQGLGRHHAATIWQLGIGDVQALGHWLGSRPFGFGETPTVVDAVLFAFIASIIKAPWDFPLKTHTLKHRNLVDHSERMLQTYFPALAATP